MRYWARAVLMMVEDVSGRWVTKGDLTMAMPAGECRQAGRHLLH